MSNVIPIVSSSPPPLDDDDDNNFKWDDDDEYGNFTSAPTLSTTTVISDSSFEVNWSNSETSLSIHDNSSKVSPVLSNNKTLTERDGLTLHAFDSHKPESFHAINHSSRPSSDSTSPNNVEVVEGDEEIQDFAHFSSSEFSKTTPHSAFVRKRNKHDPNDDSALSLPTHKVAEVNVAGPTSDDDFQDFAHFNDAAVTENMQISAVDKPNSHEMLQRGNTAHMSGTLTIEDKTTQAMETLTIRESKSHVSDTSKIEKNRADTLTISRDPHLEGQSLSPDQSSESGGSVYFNINDSIYSSISTVDSGVFSAHLSPSNYSGEPSDLCLDKEGRTFHKIAGVQHENTAALNPLSALRSLDDDAESLETAKEHNVLETNPDIDTSIVGYRTNTVVNHYDGNLVLASDNQNQNHLKDHSAPLVGESCASPAEEEENGEEFSEKGDFGGDGNLYNVSEEHSTLKQKGETLSHFSSSEQDGSHSSVCSNVMNQVSVDQSGSGSPAEVVLAGLDTKHKGELQDAGLDNGTSVNSENDVERSGHSESAETSESGSVGTSQDIPKAAFCDLVPEDGTHSKVNEQDFQTETTNESYLQVIHTADKKNSGDELEEDTEFGDFSFSRGEKEEDPVEIAPITFRTSICEADDNENNDENEEEEDFSFRKERPPVLDDKDGSDSDEFGGDVKKMSENDDDFGEFDSAQSFQPQNSASVLNKRVEDDDDFGDFGKSEAADDSSGWADFGAALVSSEVSTSVSSFTTTQTTVSANNEQNKNQKLRDAVISCFPESPVQAFIDKIQVDPVTDEKHSQNENSPVNQSAEDEGPLPLDTVVDLGLSKALEAKQQTWAVVQHPAKKDPKVRLWAHLKDVDSCHALMYGWHSSHCSKEVYTTLHIDTQNILFTQKKQVVPFFTSGLGILEPIRGVGGGTDGGALERKKEKKNIPTTEPSLLESAKYDYQQGAAPQDIPPVDFDWGSSGLTNPLTANTLDLDFLVIQGSDSYEKTSVFKTDSQESSPSVLQPLEEIMKKTTPTAKLTTNEVLSPEASRVLEKMPDLSFMMSRVLMFPVKQ